MVGFLSISHPGANKVPAAQVGALSLVQQGAKLAEGDEDTDIGTPILTVAEQDKFLDEATTVLEFLRTSVGKAENETDLRGACQDLMYPCLATVGKCLQSGISGEAYDVATEACECFAEGYANHIPFEKPTVQLSCSYGCLDEISEVFREFLESVNPTQASGIACPRTLSHIAKLEYGSDNGAFVESSDADSMHTESTTDARVVRAATALQEHINLVRSQECSDKPVFEGNPLVLYDERGTAEDALGQYRLEVQFGSEEDAQVFTGRVVHVPQWEQVVGSPSSEDHDQDTRNLLGRFRVMQLAPDPCAEGASATLAVTHARVGRINQQSLSWRAAFRSEHEGVPLSRFGLGLVLPPAHVIKASQVQMAAGIEEWEPPESYDARDTREGQAPCRAFDVLDQGPCGSCYAFAAASALSARMCLHTHRKWNVVLSPQEMMDCDNGCDGGWPYAVFRRIADKEGFAVEDFCDPYVARKEVCCGTCDEGHEFHAVDGSVFIAGGAHVAGVKSMQMQLLLRGPGVVGFHIFDDFMSYSGGVYHKSEGARPMGAHAVSLIGWGTEDGVDFWLLQNSWGRRVGEDGIWKMRRGTDEGGIESFGLTFATPEWPPFCPDTACANGGVPLRDCSCRCNGGWAGPTCEECALECHHGGQLAPDCNQCWCPPGRYGSDCSGKVTLSAGAACDAGSALSVRWEFLSGGDSTPPIQRSFIGFFPLDATHIHHNVAWQFACGGHYDAAVNAGLCPPDHQVPLSGEGRRPSEPGTYKVALIEFKPKNEFGQAGYPRVLRDSHVFAHFTLTSNCSAVAAAAEANDLLTAFKASLAERAAAAVTAQAQMTKRLDAAAAARSAIVPTPQLQIMGVDPEDPCVWASGAPLDICWSLPGGANPTPKHLVLFTGGSDSTKSLASALIDAGPSTAAPAEEAGCMLFQLAAALPSGQYTAAMTDKDLAKVVHVTLTVASATVSIVSYKERTTESGAPSIRLHVGWDVPADRATAEDKVMVHDAQNEVVAWFYTSCGCTGPAGGAPTPSGYEFVEIVRTERTVGGGYSVKLYAGGGDVVAAVAQDWVPWAVLGW